MATAQSVAMTGWNNSKRQYWTITPSLRPPPSSVLRFHHPDFYTVLQELLPLGGHVDSNPSHGYIGERPGSEGSFNCTHQVPARQKKGNKRMPLSSPLSSSALLCTEMSQQLCHSQSSRQSLPTPEEYPYDHMNCTTSSSEVKSFNKSGHHSSQKDTQRMCHSAHYQRMSLKEQRVSVRSPSSAQTSGEHHAHVQKSTVVDANMLATCQSGKHQSVRKSTGGNDHELKQSRLVATPNGSIQLSSSCVRNVGMGTAPQECLDSEEKKTRTKSNNPIWSDIKNMTQKQLDHTEELFMSANECAITLIFSNQSTQLRDKKAKSTKHVIEIDGVCVAVPTTPSAGEASNLQFYFLPLDPLNRSLDSWCKTQLLNLFHHARVICYGGQEIVSTLINHYTLHSQADVWLEWRPLDVKVGAWLLDPDNVSNNFHQVLSRFNIQLHTDSAHQACFEACTCQDLSLVGPLMVKIYHHLLEHNLWPLFSEVETKLVPILGSMDAIGIQVDTDKLLHFDELLKLKISQVESSAHKAANSTFSINSTLQLRQVLFDELQLDKQCSKKLSKTHVLKHKSTSEAVLIQLQDLHPLPGLVLEYRQTSYGMLGRTSATHLRFIKPELCKMKATYITGILPYISEGVLHPCWQHTGAATGRLVSCNPNIQAFPKQAIDLGTVTKQFVVGKEGVRHSVEVREAVVSREDHSFVATDFRSIELRLLAHLSGDPALISIFTTQPQSSSSDVFTHLAAQWLNVSVEKVSAGDRERAKRVVYAIVYGVGKDKLAEILSMNSNAAKELMTSFLSRFSGVQTFMQNVVTETRNKGYAQTICHRKRWFPQINAGNPHLRSYSERQAVNFPIQGSAADICKCGMVQVMQMLTYESPQTRLLLQIHDELLFEVPDQDVQLVSEKVRAVLESVDLIPSCRLKVPLEVRVTVGKNWATLTSELTQEQTNCNINQ